MNKGQIIQNKRVDCLGCANDNVVYTPLLRVVSNLSPFSNYML